MKIGLEFKLNYLLKKRTILGRQREKYKIEWNKITHTPSVLSVFR